MIEIGFLALDVIKCFQNFVGSNREFDCPNLLYVSIVNVLQCMDLFVGNIILCF